MTEKETERPRGFGFVTFDDCETVENICSIKHFKIRDKEDEVKKAISKEDIQRTDSGSGMTPRPGESRLGSGDMYGPHDYYREHPPHDYRMQGYEFPSRCGGMEGYYMGGYPRVHMSAFQYGLS